jgi:hypothetical protein
MFAAKIPETSRRKELIATMSVSTPLTNLTLFDHKTRRFLHANVTPSMSEAE